ncbi:hypothetical protein [Peristeroidobacter soli]|uniref:hypothetical protein n=1 Tax=Peristeroidobacter soli TaxID=2497877 RepID=UPI00101C04F2|nr:hypothetical protein [Peristeroidobacter soli]
MNASFAGSRLLLIGLLANSAWQTAAAEPRNFLMALWRSNDQAANIEEEHTDLAWFWPSLPQPSRKAILQIDGYYQDPTALTQLLTNANYDWSKIAAVWIDEPYLNAVGAAQNPCGVTSVHYGAMTATQLQVAAAAQTVRNLSATTRVWVNFSENEIKWMRDHGCDLNKSYLDVVSIDAYQGPFFDEVEPLYYYLKTHAPTNYQQRALVPLVGSKQAPNALAPASVAGWLPAYFEYAAYENQTCNLPLGPTGATGLFDGCPVWLIAGWPGVHYTVDTYVGFFDDTSEPIRDAWRAQRQIIRADHSGAISSTIDAILE